jgi:GNAT superfamily N-acetyltransferase/drug/metabolite transporter (DMT)-like permease
VNEPLAVTCGLGASLLYAFASVLQQRTAAAVDAEHSLRLGLFNRLLRNPVWVVGVGCDVAGYVLQFIAIDVGSLVLVQPLLVCGLLFALPIGARLNGSRLTRLDWFSALAVCAGLAVFQLFAAPAAGRDFIRPAVWLLLFTAGGGLTILLAGIGQAVSGRAKALCLSASAGTIYGVAAALTKTTGGLLSHGVLSTFAHWEPYALAIAGLGGMLIAQSAFQAGALDVSLPTMSAMDPVISICIGAMAFGETIAVGTGTRALEVISLIVMVAGIFGLAHSPAVRRAKEQGEHQPSPSLAPVPAPEPAVAASAPASPRWGPFFTQVPAAVGSVPARRPVTVRAATGDDAPALSDLLARAWRATYAELMSPETIEKAIDEYYGEDRIRHEAAPSLDGRDWSGYLLAEDATRHPLATIGGGMTAPGVGEVFVLYADPERRREGAGRALLRALSAPQVELGATEQWVSVTKGNRLGMPFYLAQGFEVVEEVDPWDGPGAEEGLRYLRMRRSLGLTRPV